MANKVDNIEKRLDKMEVESAELKSMVADLSNETKANNSTQSVLHNSLDRSMASLVAGIEKLNDFLIGQDKYPDDEGWIDRTNRRISELENRVKDINFKQVKKATDAYMSINWLYANKKFLSWLMGGSVATAVIAFLTVLLSSK